MPTCQRASMTQLVSITRQGMSAQSTLSTSPAGMRRHASPDSFQLDAAPGLRCCGHGFLMLAVCVARQGQPNATTHTQCGVSCVCLEDAAQPPNGHSIPNMAIHEHTHTHTHTRARMHGTYTYIHTCTCTCTRTCTPTPTPTHPHAQLPACVPFSRARSLGIWRTYGSLGIWRTARVAHTHRAAGSLPPAGCPACRTAPPAAHPPA